MVYALPDGTAIHDPGPVAEGILKDVGWSGSFAALYFPHIAAADPWQTEIAVINMSDQTVAGILRALSDGGLLVETKAVTLSARGRKQINVANEFTNHSDIGYMIFDTDTDAIEGYTKFYIDGAYRAAIPAVKAVNTSNIYIPHIASAADWWTGVSLLNTTSSTKGLTFTFSNGQSKQISLNANEHRAFDIASLFNNQPQPGIQWAVISNASGVIGLELFGSRGWGTQLEGILLTDKTSTTLYYPHVAGNEWWTGIVAFNPSALSGTITIAPYSDRGTALSSSQLSIAGHGEIFRRGFGPQPSRSDGLVQDQTPRGPSAALSFSAPTTDSSLQPMQQEGQPPRRRASFRRSRRTAGPALHSSTRKRPRRP